MDKGRGRNPSSFIFLINVKLNIMDKEKFEKYYKEITSYECDIFRFDSKILEKDFVIKKRSYRRGTLSYNSLRSSRNLY